MRECTRPTDGRVPQWSESGGRTGGGETAEGKDEGVRWGWNAKQANLAGQVIVFVHRSDAAGDVPVTAPSRVRSSDTRSAKDIRLNVCVCSSTNVCGELWTYIWSNIVSNTRYAGKMNSSQCWHRRKCTWIGHTLKWWRWHQCQQRMTR